MSITDNLKSAGYKPKESTDGSWEPYKGTYAVTWKALRHVTDGKAKDGTALSPYLECEWDIDEVLEGDQKRDSKYAAFNKRIWLEGEDQEKVDKGVQKLCDWAFTFGVDPDMTSDEAMIESLKQVVGKQGYIRGWGWTPKDSDKALQSFVVQKKDVAERKRSAESVGF